MSTTSGSVPDVYALIPPDVFVGVGMILPCEGHFLLGIRPPKLDHSQPVLELTAIGGAMEKCDASLSAGALRESEEEIGCTVSFTSCCETLVVRDGTHMEWVRILGPERPAVVVFRHYRTPPHEPWHIQHKGRSCLILFLAEVDGEPSLTDELPAAIWLSPEQILRVARQDVPLQDLLDQGARFLEAQPGSLPRDALARLTDSQEALVLALGQTAVWFYRELVRRCAGQESGASGPGI